VRSSWLSFASLKKSFVVLLVAVATLGAPRPASAQLLSGLLDQLPLDLVWKILTNDQDKVSVIVEAPQSVVDSLASTYGVTVSKRLLSGAVLTGTPAQLARLAQDPRVPSLAVDRPVIATQTVDTQATGANLVWPGLLKSGYNGAGIGVAVIDSGISSHPDLNGRVYYSYDLVDPSNGGKDGYGHGTHVAGIIAGNGTASLLKDKTLWSGMAQGANLINVRVLGDEGSGLTSNVVEGIDWCIQNKARFNIRVINISLGHLPVERPENDPLVRAVNRAVAADIVVVASAGNFGKLSDGTPVVNAVVSPGIASSAITVGAVNTRGTAKRSDDVMSTWSSRGPVGDQMMPAKWQVKPDLVAPGNAILSAAQPGSYLWDQLPADRHVNGLGGGYLKLSGTSMATPMVSGAVALMLQAKPNLKPAQVKFALQITSQLLPGYGLIEQGAGSMDVPLAMASPQCSAAMAPTGTASRSTVRRWSGAAHSCGATAWSGATPWSGDRRWCGARASSGATVSCGATRWSGDPASCGATRWCGGLAFGDRVIGQSAIGQSVNGLSGNRGNR
jgi:serine protease AprX